MLLDLQGDVAKRYLEDENYVVFYITGHTVPILYHRSSLLNSPEIFEEGELQMDVLYELKKERVVYVMIDDKDFIRLQTIKRIGEGVYGDVLSMPKWDVVIKEYKVMYSFIIELAIYELIAKVYPNPEEVNLPRFLGFGKRSLILPKYDRTLQMNDEQSLFKGVANGLYHLHKIGIVHRDVKFSNVMISSNKAIVIDFGIATWNPFSRNKIRQTSIQSYPFRAPEVAFDKGYKKRLTSKIDEWSFGVLLASKTELLFNVRSVKGLCKQMEKSFGTFSEDIFEKPLYINTIEEAKPFLCSQPSMRKSLNEYLGLPKFNNDDIVQNIPIATEIFRITLEDQFEFANTSVCVNSYFGGMMYFGMLKNKSFSNIVSTQMLSDIVYGGRTTSFDGIVNFIKEINCQLLRLNTYFLLVLEYPDNIKKIIMYCYVLSICGNLHSHRDQADWIAKAFFHKNIPHRDVFDRIRETYIQCDLLMDQKRTENLAYFMNMLHPDIN